MKTKLLVPIIGGSFLLVATIITVVFNNNSSKETSNNTTVQINPMVDKSTNINEVENLTINQH